MAIVASEEVPLSSGSWVVPICSTRPFSFSIAYATQILSLDTDVEMLLRMMSFVDSLEDSVSYEDFIAEMKLGEMQEYPAALGGGDLSELSGYWEFNHGYRVDVDFGPDEMLVYATIWADSNNHSFCLWGWTRGDRERKDAFEKQMQRFKRP